MKKWYVHRSGASPLLITGETLIEAIESGFGVIAKAADIGNAAGYKLLGVETRYNKSILGGQGGAEVTIEASGLDLAHQKASGDIQTKKVWIQASAEDIPEPYTHDKVK